MANHHSAKSLLAAALLSLLAGGGPAQAQDPTRSADKPGTQYSLNTDPAEPKEAPVPPPPAFDLKRLLPIAMPPHLSLKFGVDPQTLSLGADGVVRYVVVAHREAGHALNVFYEGVRCSTDEYTTYARHGSEGWRLVAQPEWQKISTRISSYTDQLSRQSLCRGRAPHASVSDMVHALQYPQDHTR